MFPKFGHERMNAKKQHMLIKLPYKLLTKTTKTLFFIIDHSGTKIQYNNDAVTNFIVDSVLELIGKHLSSNNQWSVSENGEETIQK